MNTERKRKGDKKMSNYYTDKEINTSRLWINYDEGSAEPMGTSWEQIYDAYEDWKISEEW